MGTINDIILNSEFLKKWYLKKKLGTDLSSWVKHEVFSGLFWSALIPIKMKTQPVGNVSSRSPALYFGFPGVDH